jgi:hypothetical protein
MNLTDNNCFETRDGYGCEMVSAVHQAASQALKLAANMTAGRTPKNSIQNAQLNGFFSSLANSVKSSLIRTNLFPIVQAKALVSGGPKAAWNATTTELRAAQGDAAGPIGQVVTTVAPFFGPIGKLVAVAVAFAGADYQRKQAKAAQLVQSGAGGAELIAKYKEIAGQIPGRLIGVDGLKQILGTFVNAGGYPPLTVDREPGSPASRVAYEFALQAAQAALVNNPNAAAGDVYRNEFQRLRSVDPRNAWIGGMYVQKGVAQEQLFIDLIDAALASINSQAPFSYGIEAPQEVAAPVVNVNSTLPPGTFPPVNVSLQPVNISPIVTPPATLPANISPSVTPPVALTSAGVDQSTQNYINALLAQMKEQGANNAQMMQASMAALAQRGVNTSAPRVQSAVAADVQQVQTAGLANVNPWLLAGLGGIALVFALARPGRTGTSRGARARLGNPRYRKRRRSKR